MFVAVVSTVIVLLALMDTAADPELKTGTTFDALWIYAKYKPAFVVELEFAWSTAMIYIPLLSVNVWVVAVES